MDEAGGRTRTQLLNMQLYAAMPCQAVTKPHEISFDINYNLKSINLSD